MKQTFQDHKTELEEAAKGEVIFEQATTNETVRIALDKERPVKPEIIYISTILNEIAGKVGRGKGKEDVIKATTIELVTIVNKAANKQFAISCLYMIGNPYTRQDPKWIEERIRQIKFYMNEESTKYSPQNVTTALEPEITPEDLEADKVHLNQDGKKKFAARLVEHIKLGKEEIEKYKGSGEADSDKEWDSLERPSQKTPKTNKKATKRTRNPSENEEIEKKKSKEDSSVTDVMKEFIAEMRDDRKKQDKRTTKLEEQVTTLKAYEIESKQNFVKIWEAQEKDEIYTATVREDLDVVENESLKNTVIVKKLRAAAR